MTGLPAAGPLRWGSLPAAFLLAALAGGCASQASRPFEGIPEPVEVSATPFYPQERFQCGPAALMTVLDYSGVDASLDELVDAVYLPGREGSLQPELIAATRAAGRLPYPVDGTLDSIAAELGGGRPVLVLQNLGVSWFPRWHYAVVYRVDPADRSVWLRSGTEPARRTPAATFLRTWARAGNWGFVALPPGELPAEPDQARYFPAVAALEETGHAAAARDAWLVAIDEWPQSPIPLFGAGNAELALGNFAIAERYYRRLLEGWPEQTMASNNLAIALARQGETRAAVAVIEAALARPGLDPALVRALDDTLAELDPTAN